MTDSPPAEQVARALDPARAAGGVVLVVAILVGATGYLLNGRLTGGGIALESAPVLTLLATMAGAAGILALIRAPATHPAPQLVLLSAAVSVLLALAPLDRRATDGTLWSFLLVAPWRYALTPLVVHSAFAIGWPHRSARWTGLVTGWYLLHAGMLLATIGGLATDERPLLVAIDSTFRLQVLEPAGLIAAALTLAIALAAAEQRRSRRRAIIWGSGAVVLGFGPLVAATFIPDLDAAVGGLAATSHLALVMLPILGLASVMSLPFLDPAGRDLLAFRTAQKVLDTPELANGLRAVATDLLDVLEAQSVVLRLSNPPITVTAGTPRLAASEGVIAPEMETRDDGRTLLAPIGRVGDPLGDLRLEGRFTSAFTTQEEGWLAAFLKPLSAAIRTRQRGMASEARTEALRRQVSAAIDGLQAAAARLPASAAGESAAVPPPVDAREVLVQLGEGVDRVARGGEDLEVAANDVRDRTRGATDTIARALDALLVMNGELSRLALRGQEIAAHNDTVSGIAFRTNLLANNAALEATRAGTAGRAFGVLADEISRLADTTAETSTAIGAETTALSNELTALRNAMLEGRTALEGAIREAEASEESSQRLSDIAAALEGAARSLRPAVEEANAVAKRRSARDQHLTGTLERFTGDRIALARALNAHRGAIEEIVERLRRIENDVPPRRDAGRAQDRA